MPYVSEAQRGKFHELEKEGKISPATVAEFDKASKGIRLPKKVGMLQSGVRKPKRS
jgi:hypothetical protein